MVTFDNEMHGNIGGAEKVCDESDNSRFLNALINMIPGEVTAMHQGSAECGDSDTYRRTDGSSGPMALGF